MKPNTLSRITLFVEGGRREIERPHAGLVKLFAFVVLPSSLVLPAMVYYTGVSQAVAFLPQMEGRDWGLIALACFLAELLTLLLTGWFIGQVAQTNGIRIGYHDAYRLAALAPLPLWLSSLGLFVSSPAFNAALWLTAFGMSCTIVYQGIVAVRPSDEKLTAVRITQTVVSAGLIVWVLTLTLGMLV